MNDIELFTIIMEAREILESDPSIKEIRELNEQNEQALAKSFEKIKEYLDKKDFEKAKEETMRVQYLKTLQRELKEKLPAE